MSDPTFVPLKAPSITIDANMNYLQALALPALAIACSVAVAQDARDRGFIRTGMHEGEVIFRIGKPDHEAIIANVKGKPEEKTWTYFPHSRDPQTLTIITLRAGVVAEIERKVSR